MSFFRVIDEMVTDFSLPAVSKKPFLLWPAWNKAESRFSGESTPLRSFLF